MVRSKGHVNKNLPWVAFWTRLLPIGVITLCAAIGCRASTKPETNIWSEIAEQLGEDFREWSDDPNQMSQRLQKAEKILRRVTSLLRPTAQGDARQRPTMDMDTASITFRPVMRLLLAASERASRRGQHAEAVDYALDLFALADVMSHNCSSVTEYQLACVTAKMGFNRLLETVGHVDASTLESALVRLRHIAGDWDSGKQVGERELAGAMQRDRNLAQMELQSGSFAAASRRIDILAKTAQARMALAQTVLLACLYRHQHGTFPDSMESLSAWRQADMLLDPFSGKPLRVERRENAFTCYSVGQDGQDDGGRQCDEGRLSMGMHCTGDIVCTVE